MSYLPALCLVAASMATLGGANAQALSGVATPVGVENFVRAESDLYMGRMVEDGDLGRLVHSREPVSIEKQNVIRMNRDTLYSQAVFDLDAGPVTVTLPDTGRRFMSMQVVNQDHYVPSVHYGAGSYTLTKEDVGTRYAFVLLRMLVDPDKQEDVREVHALQDAVEVNQAGVGKFEVPDWDQQSQKKVRDALLVLGSTLPDYKEAFGPEGDVDPIQHLIGTATGWGGNPAKDATYLTGGVPRNDGTALYTLTVGEVPVDSFWSVSVYNAEGYFEKTPYDAYSLNNLTAEKSADGSIVIQFGGCDGKIVNCLPTMPGWNYTVRLYQPRPEILSGEWRFPEPRPLQ